MTDKPKPSIDTENTGSNEFDKNEFEFEIDSVLVGRKKHVNKKFREPAQQVAKTLGDKAKQELKRKRELEVDQNAQAKKRQKR
jgi:hypothetical protein